MQKKTNGKRCEEFYARRLKKLPDEQHRTALTRIIPPVDHSSSSIYIAFGAVQVLLISSVLALRVNLM